MTWTLDLPYVRPPLTANDRMHHMVKARRTAAVRQTAGWLARANRVPALARCSVSLHYAPVDRRRRDADNLVPTLKALCDGLVDAGVVRDDTPDLMVKAMPVIEPPEHPARLWLVVTDLGAP